jgi:NadR type nicotinamide-nucleotide adenylyltransferase
MEKIPSQKRTTIKRIVLFGPESTGKTTLAKQLSEKYDVPWVAEYAREYLQDKWDCSRAICQPEDLVPIAIGQMKLENEAIIQAENEKKQFIVCDTDLLETLVYSEVYYNGWADQRLLDAVSAQNYDLYLLTGIDVPWVADDLRDKPHKREKMYEAFRSALEANGCNYISLQGNQTTRLESASTAIEALF